MAKFIEELEDENYEVVEVFEHPALLFQCRLEDIPGNLFHYDLRGSDYDPGDICSITPKRVGVNFVGTVVMAERLDIDQEVEADVNFIYNEAVSEIFDKVLQHAFAEIYHLANNAFFLCWLNEGGDRYNSLDCSNLMAKILPEFSVDVHLLSLYNGIKTVNEAEKNLFERLQPHWENNEHYAAYKNENNDLTETVVSMEWYIYAPHRCFRNEVEVPSCIQKLLDCVFKLAGEVKECEDKILVELYDFGDYPINFSSLKAAESFLERFDLAPYTVFENKGDDGWVELYSV